MKVPQSLRSKAFVSSVVMILIMTVNVELSQGSTCSSTFFSALVQLIPCRTAVSPFGPVPPSETCCNAVKTLGQPCLCVLVNGPPISGVDRSMALQLPDKCASNFDPCKSRASIPLDGLSRSS
ncbi:unnamed protein product [Amaranthus hypochondriacus]